MVGMTGDEVTASSAETASFFLSPFFLSPPPPAAARRFFHARRPASPRPRKAACPACREPTRGHRSPPQTLRSRSRIVTWPSPGCDGPHPSAPARSSSKARSAPTPRRSRPFLLVRGSVMKKVGELLLALRIPPRERRETAGEPRGLRGGSLAFLRRGSRGLRGI